MPQVPFSTSDTPLAAFLCASGFELLGLERNGKTFFQFEATSELLQAVISYQNRTAQIDPLTFHAKYRDLIDMIRGGNHA